MKPFWALNSPIIVRTLQSLELLNNYRHYKGWKYSDALNV